MRTVSKNVAGRLRRGAPLAAALLASAVVAAPAQAVGIGTNGPLDAAFGNYPAWYEDAIGQRLEPCIDGPQCLATIERPDPTAPVSFPDNFPVEQFWFEANAVIGDPLAPTVELVLAQEGAFGGASEGVVDGEQVAFGRLRIRVFGGLAAGKVYRVTHPYGADEFVAAAGARQINFTDDVGCFTLPCGVADYASTSGSRIGPSFLQWDTRVSMPPAGWIGDSTVPHEVVGSPFGTNFLKIEELTGPEGTPVRTVFFTDKFSVQGKLAPGAAPVAWLSVPSGSDAGGQLRGGTAAAKTVAVANSGGGTLTLQGITLGGANAGDFALDASACGASLAPGQACNLSYTFTPSAAGARSATVTVASNVGTQTIALTGNGSEPPPPVVSVTPATVLEQPGLPIVQPSRRLRVGTLKTISRLTLRRARREGIVVKFTMPAAARVARAQLYRGKKLVASRSLTGRGTRTVRFKRGLRTGRYLIKVRVGQSVQALGPATTKRVRITRR